MINATSFNKTEILEINRFVKANIPYSVLEQVFPLTENPKKKAEVFTIIYRIMHSAYGYVDDDKTKSKLKELLDTCRKEYDIVYAALLELDTEVSYGQDIIFNKIKDIFKNFESNFKINNMINVFLVFAEKHILRDIDKVIGVVTDDLTGANIVDELSKQLTD